MTNAATERPRDVPTVEERRATPLSPFQACLLPGSFGLALLLFGLAPSVRAVPRLWGSIEAASLAVLAWTAGFYIRSRATHRVFELAVVLRKQHYVQAFAHTSIFVYWGMYWNVAGL